MSVTDRWSTCACPTVAPAASPRALSWTTGPMSMRSPATYEAAYIEVSCTPAPVPIVSSRHAGAGTYETRREVRRRRRR
jgi:hypothetical protein